jgi:diguanylate cyclase (GGDEF)-like protein/PAS domain S-box-containing protein
MVSFLEEDRAGGGPSPRRPSRRTKPIPEVVRMSDPAHGPRAEPLHAEEDRQVFMAESFDLAQDGYLITDLDAVIGVANRAASTLLGRARERLIGTSLRTFLVEGSQEALSRLVAKLKGGHLALEGKLSLRPSHGGPLEVTVAVSRGGAGAGGHSVLHWVLHDITDHEVQLRRLEYLAYHDHLTGLANRRMLFMRLRQAIARARRNDRGVALIFLDVDRFKLINDHLGHGAGDELLRKIGDRLQSVSREAETIGRLAGDEFLLVIEDLEVRDGAGHHRAPPEPNLAARRILGALESPYEVAGVQIYVSASIGISVYPADGQDVNALIERADRAVYADKRRARRHPLIAADDRKARSAFASLGLLEHPEGDGKRSGPKGHHSWKGRPRWPEAGGETIVESDFPATTAAAGMARAASAAGLNGLSREVVDSVILLVSELVTNSIRHAGLPANGPINLVIRILSDRLRVEVTDDGPGIRRSDLNPDPMNGRGLGLLLVDEIATAWGTHIDPAGVWFEMEREPAAS